MQHCFKGDNDNCDDESYNMEDADVQTGQAVTSTDARSRSNNEGKQGTEKNLQKDH